jgi:hypothetical protein
MTPAREEKKILKVDLGPASYDALNSFKHGKGDDKPKFYVAKSEKESFLNIAMKKNRGKPSPGQYNIEAADKFITKGVSKGYK